MPRSVVFHPAARAEFRAAVAEYEAQRAGLGTAMALEVRELVDLARAFPQMGSPYSVPVRPPTFSAHVSIRRRVPASMRRYSSSLSRTDIANPITGTNGSRHRRAGITTLAADSRG